ncbi:hypothetical protein OEB99_10460 [Actinotalea sp. M2MS4P-6]|uniref:hypothetical protein n=1 Tax=Actinotalea sp. M2MS4P-6 TaxID=2983762 RepID=UPI0021E440EB|nr:hypothetical protein [Actinotalea sp. M2MS4P-6]MCV2394729.1 hypothetical protein [Actinotalea sp. M2MS4P-6]
MSRNAYLRLGIILTVTGVIALIHRFAVTTTRLPPGVELAVAIVLIVVGLPLLVRGTRRRGRPSDSDRGGR